MPLSIAEITPQVGELQRVYLYKLMIEDYPASVKSIFSEADVVAENIDLYNLKGVFPDRTNAEIEVKWAGEKMYFSGVDNTDHKFELDFMQDELQKLYDFFSACKDLTGTLRNQASVPKPIQTLTLGAYQVDASKSVVTNYIRLNKVLILGVKLDPPDKTGDQFSHLKVNGTWDTQTPDKTLRGRSI
jgi:hypothetical protein